MDWHKVTVPFHQQKVESEQKMKSLEDGFKALLLTKGSPAEAALFLLRDDQEKLYTYYFSPAAMDFSRDLVTQRRGERCEAPSPKTEGLTWVAGDRTGAMEPYGYQDKKLFQP